jgi:hypothetical protein
MIVPWIGDTPLTLSSECCVNMYIYILYVCILIDCFPQMTDIDGWIDVWTEQVEGISLLSTVAR